MTREEAMTAYGLIPMPTIEAKQMNAGDDYHYGVYVNDHLVGVLHSDTGSELTAAALKRALLQGATT